MSGKAKTLAMLKPRISSSEILDQYCFKLADWRESPDRIMEAVKDKGWLDICLIVRSAAAMEDGSKESFAGHFASVGNVKGIAALKEAIEQVGNSFAGYEHPENSVFIQPMLEDVACSGVALTRDPVNGAPYIKINYDRTGKTDGITSGTSNDCEVFYYHKAHTQQLGDFRDQVIALCRELEKELESDALDIEFAVDQQGTLYLFQVRPLAVNNAMFEMNDEEHYEHVGLIARAIEEWLKKHPYLYGERGILGVMPDWNPAEIIGIKPKPLALSLYREVVTNSIWAYQRDNYGYCNLRSFPLLVELEGMPYIDIRVSFNSFIPKLLDEAIAEKLVNYYLEKLKEQPHLHDKVEFEIVYSSFNFKTPERLSELLSNGFSEDEIDQISDALLKTTNSIINHDDGLWLQDIAKIEELKARYETIMSSDLGDFSKIYWLIEDCKRYGTLPFAGLARSAFIAVELLNSLRDSDIISNKEYQQFFFSINTVSSEISRDFHEMKRELFIEKYGHLRPGTYDILSKSYDEDSENYFDWNQPRSANDRNPEPFELNEKQLSRIDAYLAEQGFSVDAKGLIGFMKEAIEAREYSKFVFTKNINQVLNIYSKVCEELGISREDSAYTHINSIMSLNSSATDPKKILKASIKRRKKRFELTKSIHLPPVITSSTDAFFFFEEKSAPNYVTQKEVTAEVCVFSQGGDQDIRGKIVLIENADPGYDWIFSHNIAGLVTKYGGANSHMSIRSSELGIPAIIGAGNMYEQVRRHKKVTIDCLNKVFHSYG